MKKFTVKIPIYQTEVVILQQKSFKDLVKKYELKPEFEDADALAITDPKKNRYIMAFREKTNSGLISHEALHITHAIFLDRNILVNAEDDEHQCYLLQYLVDQTHKVLKIKS